MTPITWESLNEAINRGTAGAALVAIAFILLLAFWPKIVGKTK